ncbi:MAG: hypothetical protein QXD48_04015 [Candidatus Aenigmatarchaeota archaeon]
MDDFMLVLIAAGIILILLLAFGTPVANWLESEAGRPQEGKYQFIDEFSLGSVGYIENEIERTIEFGSFILGYDQTEILKSIRSAGVSKGLFSSDSKEYKIDVDQNILERLKRVKIRFSIAETNLYGDLIIKWNGKVVFQDKANLRNYDISVEPQYVKNSNILEISCSAPFYFWASTTYELNGIEVIAEYGPDKFFSFKLYGFEKESWDKGVLSFYTTRGSNKLTIKFNGIEIYNAIPEHIVNIEINYSDVPIKIGDNILVLKSDSKLEIDDLKLDIILSTNKVTRERSFNITKDEYDLLKKGEGEIAFYIDDIYRQGVLSISINDKELNVQTLQRGWNYVKFTKDDVSEGINYMKFSGNGGWKISDVKIGIKY